MAVKRYRLVTKGDFDGMVSGVLLKHRRLIAKAAFVHPREIESGRFAITGDDVTAGLPYRESAHLAFDHYRPAGLPASVKNLVTDTGAHSASRVIFGHYGADRFFGTHAEMVEAVDRHNSALISSDDILYPTGWTLLGFLIDNRTGLQDYGKHRLTHDELMNHLISEAGTRSVWEILDLPDVEERLNLYFACVEDCKSQILRRSSVHANLVVTDIRGEKTVYPGNKFLTYALFPECDVSLHVSHAGALTLFSAGKSVLDRNCRLDIGVIMKKFGGGGHPGAGACRVEEHLAEETLSRLIKELKYGPVKNLLMGYFNYY